MKIKYGFNRLVLIFDNYSIKIARFYPIRFIARILTLPFVTKDSREKFFKNYGRDFRKSIPRYIFSGIVCNRREYRYSKKYPDDARINATLEMYLYGFIVIQKKGEQISEEEFIRINPFLEVKDKVSCETYLYWQFCIFEGVMKLVDYGSILTIKDLLRTK